jgi:hypothetical protein
MSIVAKFRQQSSLLGPWVVQPFDVPFVHIPDDVFRQYQASVKKFEAKEHCEIQLAITTMVLRE